MSQTSHSSGFDPCSIFPARIKRRKFTAEPIKRGGAAAGATDLIKGNVMIPTANTAYARTVRLHEALHAIYTEKPSRERIKSGKGYSTLEQALEDARLHLNCAKTEGIVRRDELTTALRDLHATTSKSKPAPDKNIAALIALRSAAILTSQPEGDDHLTGRSAANRFKALCDKVAPDYRDKVFQALERIAAGEMPDAERILTPYFDASAPPPPSGATFPLAGKGEPESGDGDGKYADVSFDKIEGKLSSEAADMLGAGTIEEINKCETMPRLRIVQLFASAMISTWFGEDTKHVISGTKIHAKKLATIVGPSVPKVFLKTIRRNGGTVLIDASGSMSISPAQLLKLVNSAPAATIAFYNAPTDFHLAGNLWVYAHKGKRASDFAGIEFLRGPDGTKIRSDHRKTEREAPDTVYGWGNVVDFQALQWLLAQPAPRYVLTDGDFTGPWESRQAGQELLRNAIARKKLTQVQSLAETEKLLAGGMR